MLIIVSRLLVAAVFLSAAIAVGCFATAKIREKFPSQKSIKKQTEKQQKKFEKEAESEIEVEYEDFSEMFESKARVVEYGKGAFSIGNSEWKEYIKKLIISGHLEETKNAAFLSKLKVADKDGKILLECLADISDINDICTNNNTVNGGIVAPFKSGDVATIINTTTKEVTHLNYEETFEVNEEVEVEEVEVVEELVEDSEIEEVEEEVETEVVTETEQVNTESNTETEDIIIDWGDNIPDWLKDDPEMDK